MLLCWGSVALLGFLVKWNNGMERLESWGEEKEKPSLWFTGKKVEGGTISRAEVYRASSYTVKCKGFWYQARLRQRASPNTDAIVTEGSAEELELESTGKETC